MRTSVRLRRQGLLIAAATALTSLLAPPSASAATWHAVDTIGGSGLAAETETFGAVPVDYNGDGRQDVWIAYHDQGGKLFRNNGDGTYTRVAADAWPKYDPVSGKIPDRHQCVWADVDQDGRPDVFCGTGRTGGNVVKTGMDDELWLQRTPGRFTDVGTGWGLGDVCGRSWYSAFINVNGDRYPDLYVGNIPPRDVPSDPCANPLNGYTNRYAKLYINEGGKGFRYAPHMGLALYGGKRCAEVVDFNKDGWDDLLTCDGNGLHLYRNDAGRRFTDVSAENGFGTTECSDAKFADLNGDGWPDLVTARYRQFGYRLNMHGRFGPEVRIAATSGGGGRAVALGDADGNGTIDVYGLVTNAPQRTNPQDFIYLDNGLQFTAVPVPPAGGIGDAVAALDPNSRKTAFLVLNGQEIPGPTQRIELVSR